MKKRILPVLLALCIAGALLAGCTGGDASGAVAEGNAVDSGSATSAPPDAVQESIALVRSMMALDYEGMSVAAFNDEIQRISDDAGKNFFEVVANAYEGYEGFDKELDDFIRSTIEYSAQDIFGEPVYMGNASYRTTRSVTAADMLEKQRQMEPAAFSAYLDGILADIDIYTTVFYTLEFTIVDGEALLVSQRDAQLNGARAAVEDYVAGLSEDEIQAEDAKTRIAGQLEAIAAEYSSAGMGLRGELTSFESLPLE